MSYTSRLLFIGDSVTDCDRGRDGDLSLGCGYVNLIWLWYSALYPQSRAEFFNRGVSGDRIESLLGRWDKDCLELKPDFITVLIGINNIVHRFKRGIVTSEAQFREAYRAILQKTVKSVKARIIIMEPFLLPVMDYKDAPSYIPVMENYAEWRENLDPVIEIVRCLAAEFGAEIIPLDGIFKEAALKREPAFWTSDGVHPSMPGHALIAQAWFEKVRDILI
jgi:lysophospholipase L1-like esterase